MCVAVCCSVFQYVVVCRSVLQSGWLRTGIYVAVYCSVLQYIVVCCNVSQICWLRAGMCVWAYVRVCVYIYVDIQNTIKMYVYMCVFAPVRNDGLWGGYD